MRVAYILNVFPKISETFVLNEIIELQRKGLQVAVFAFHKPEESACHSQVAQVEDLTYFKEISLWSKLAANGYWFFRNPLRYIKAVIKVNKSKSGIRSIFIGKLAFLKEVEGHQPDLLHAHFGREAADFAMVGHILTGIPYTFTSHRYDIFDRPPKNYFVKTSMARKHITISDYNREFLSTRFGLRPDDMAVIHCGIDFSGLPKPDSGTLDGDPIILTVARLSKEKGLEVLLEALLKLFTQGVEFESVIIGEGPMRSELEQLILRSGLQDRVSLIGEQTQDQVFSWIRRSSVIAMSSFSEGIPVSLMEAMALKRPVVAPNITGIPELIDHGQSGFLFEPGNAEDLAKYIRILLEDAETAGHFVEKAYAKVYADFNLSTEVDKLLRVWETANA